MATTNIMRGGTHTQNIKDCHAPRFGQVSLNNIPFHFAVNILLSITAPLGNSLILVTLNKESSLHPPSKLLYRCLATTDLLIGFVTQPTYVTFWMSVVHEHWSHAIVIPSCVLCGVSLLTMTVISMDRPLAGTEIQRDCNFKTLVSHFSYCLDCISSR